MKNALAYVDIIRTILTSNVAILKNTCLQKPKISSNKKYKCRCVDRQENFTNEDSQQMCGFDFLGLNHSRIYSWKCNIIYCPCHLSRNLKTGFRVFGRRMQNESFFKRVYSRRRRLLVCGMFLSSNLMYYIWEALINRDDKIILAVFIKYATTSRPIPAGSGNADKRYTDVVRLFVVTFAGFFGESLWIF